MTLKNTASSTGQILFWSSKQWKELLPFVAKILFILVLWKFSGIRYWSHAYAGEIYHPSRITYYTEALISLFALGFLVLNLNLLKDIFKRQTAVCFFVLFALLIRFIPGSDNISSFLTTLGYLDSLIAVSLMLALCGPLETRNILAKFGLVFIVLNIASLAIPGVSMMVGSFSGFVRGFTAHRNDLAHVSVISLFFILCAPMRINPMLKWGVTLGGVVLIALAGSVQGIFLLLGGAAIFLCAGHPLLYKHPYVLFCAIMTIPIVVVLWQYFILNDFLEFFGRDATFTGRDRIWDLSLYLLDRMPWSGYGIGSIGNDVLSPALLLSFGLGTKFGTAHNSYIEALLSFGWIGGSLFLIAALIGAVRIIVSYLKQTDSKESLPAVLILVCVIGGLVASEKMFWPGFGWLTFVLAIFLRDYSYPTPKMLKTRMKT